MIDRDAAASRLSEWLKESDHEICVSSLGRVLTWAKDEFDREDPLPAALSQRYSFRTELPEHISGNLVDKITFIPGPIWEPQSILLVFTSTPDQFSARLALAHDFCIKNNPRNFILVTDYFDNQAFKRPAQTFQAIESRNRIQGAILLYTALGFHFFRVLGGIN